MKLYDMLKLTTIVMMVITIFFFISLWKLIRWIYRYSGFEFIARKFKPAQDEKKLPTGFIWSIGIYVAIFGIASQRYENRIDLIEYRANGIFSQLATSKEAFGLLAGLQKEKTPLKPKFFNFFNPTWEDFISPIQSLWGEPVDYEWIINQTKEMVRIHKTKLKSVNLSNIDLSKTNLKEAKLQDSILIGAVLSETNLKGADLASADLTWANLKGANLEFSKLQEAKLWNANLSHAILLNANLRKVDLWKANLQGAILKNADLKGIKTKKTNDFTIEQLCAAKTLSEIKLDNYLKGQIEKKCNHLLN